MQARVALQQGMDQRTVMSEAASRFRKEVTVLEQMCHQALGVMPPAGSTIAQAVTTHEPKLRKLLQTGLRPTQQMPLPALAPPAPAALPMARAGTGVVQQMPLPPAARPVQQSGAAQQGQGQKSSEVIVIDD